MERFENITSSGNEKAIRRGKKVPDGDINLAWAKSPQLSPDNSMIIVDTSSTIAENINSSEYRSGFMYANHLGILQDEFGNEVIFDEYPAIADEFTVEENYDISSDNEFTKSHVLAFRHISRYFHVDQESLVMDDEPLTIDRDTIIVEDENGREYLGKDGKKRYKIRLVKSDDYLETDTAIGVYRVWVYVDTDLNESLYLRYNKVELSANGRSIKNQLVSYRETLNPQPYFNYVPEESDVADFAANDRKIYTTKTTSEKEQIIGVPKSSSEGSKVYVPKKAISDPRVFQPFRWRVVANFNERYTVDPTNTQKVIRAGILSRDIRYPRTISAFENQGSGVNYNYLNPATKFPYIFYNLQNSEYNPTGAEIVNPISEKRGYTIVEDLDPAIQSPSDFTATNSNDTYNWLSNMTVPLKKVLGNDAKEYAGYWIVNFDTVTEDELKEFDVLVLDVESFSLDLSTALPKIMRFARDFGGSIYIPLNGKWDILGLGLRLTKPVHPYTGKVKMEPGEIRLAVIEESDYFGLGDTIVSSSSADELFNGQGEYGGWDFESTAYSSVSPFKFHPSALYAKDKSYVQYFWENSNSQPTENGLDYWKPLFSCRRFDVVNQKAGDSTLYPLTVIKRFASGGSIIVDAQNIIGECNSLVDSVNISPRRLQIPNYFSQINSGRFEGSYKFGWNWILSAVSQRPLNSSDQENYSSTWSFESDWKPSWVIKGEVLKDPEKLKYSFNYESKDLSNLAQKAWRRKLAINYNDNQGPVFKTLKQIIDDQIVKELGQEYLARVALSPRTYVLETTNANVSVPSTLDGDMFPYAWTESYSPEFIIPEGFGPHVVKDEPMMAQYAAGQYVDVTYPPQRFAVKVKADFEDSSQSTVRQVTTILARYRGKEVLKNGQMYSHVSKARTWTEHGSNQILFNRFSKNWGGPRPNSILSRNELLLGSMNSYPYAGIVGNYRIGDSGEVVRYIQYSLNRLHDIVTSLLTNGINGPTPIGMNRSEGYNEAMAWALKYRRPSGPLNQDGIYDQATADAVSALKVLANTRYKDGIADSEFFAVLGSQIQFWGITTETSQNTNNAEGFATNPYTYLRYTSEPNKYMNLRSVSDSSVLYNYAQISNSRENSDRISDIILIQYPKVYNFQYVSIVPYVLGEGNVNVDFVDIRLSRIDTTRFTGDMNNKAWQYYEIEEQPAPGLGWTPDLPRILWAQTPGVLNESGFNLTSYAVLEFFGQENVRQYVKMIQRALQVNPDGIFGNVTAAAALRWKTNRAYKWGIPIDNTWGLISSVQNIQKLLHVTVDGYYGPETERAVMAWQANWGGEIPIDGFWGPITQKVTDEFFQYLGGLPTVRRIKKHLPEPYFVWPQDILRGYSSANALVKNINRSGSSGSKIDIQIPQSSRAFGNTIIVGISSRSKIASGSNQVQLGISDITGYGNDTVGFNTIYGGDAVIDYEGVFTKTFDIVGDRGPIQLQHDYKSTGAPGYLTDVEWGIDPITEVSSTIFPGFNPSEVSLYRVESSNPNVEAFISKDGKLYLRTDEVINNSESKYSEGQWLPCPPDTPMDKGEMVALSSRTSTSTVIVNPSQNPIYAMDENGKMFPGVQTGFVSKAEGIKLLCDSQGRPIGFPQVPSGVGPEEAQRHYTRFSLDFFVSSTFVRVGFYDKKQKEFIINSDESSMSYIEYINRGPENVYIGVVAETESIETKNYPTVEDGFGQIPFKYAMPVYGITAKSASKIGIERIDSNLGISDIWGIPVRAGSFSRAVNVPSNSVLPISGWVSEYQGKNVKAFYSVPEASKMGWSSVYGRPYIDVKSENPTVISTDVIRVKQAPIAMFVEPTQIPSNSDPLKPRFTVWTRSTTYDEWVQVSMSDIVDYNSSNGTIYLKTPLAEEDPNLVKVDYTCLSRVYVAKKINGQNVNLNPYVKSRPELIGVPIYVYILPAYVVNGDGEIIPDSINEATLNITTDNSILNQFSSTYNPLALHIGTVFVSTAAKMQDLTLIDTRRRGGGLTETNSLSKFELENPEIDSYWDVSASSIASVQSGGFVVIRLPKMLKLVFPDTKDIEDIIRRNISAGVDFMIEDLEGRPWDE